MLNTFKWGFFTALRQWKVAAIVYFIQLCLAATLGLQVLNVFESSIGNSLEINKLIHNYDHTVISDFLKIHGASISPLIGQLRWLIVMYLLFAVFMDAGMLVSARKSAEASAVQTFWQGAATYYFPFLGIFCVFLGLALVWTGLIFMPIALYLQAALEFLPNEKYLVWGILFLLVIYLIGLLFLLLLSVLSRYAKIETQEGTFASVKNGWKTFRKNKWSYLSFLALFAAFQLLFMLFYWTISSLIGMSTTFGIVFMVLIQQIFAFSKVMLRQIFYVGIAKLSSDSNPLNTLSDEPKEDSCKR